MSGGRLKEPTEKTAGVVVELFSGPRQAEALFTRAMSLDRDPVTWRQAEKLYRRVVKLAPKHAEAWNNLGVLAYQQGRRMEALDAWARAVLADPDSEPTLNNIGHFWQEEGKYELAREYLERAVRLDAESGDARVNLALCLQALGRLHEARRHWRVYLRRFPRGPWAALAEKNERKCSAR